MSTLNVANITDGTTTLSTSYVVNGSAKAYITYGPAGGILDSFNISSVTDDNATTVGKYIHNLTSAMSQNTYSVNVNGYGTATDVWQTVATVVTTSFTTYGWDATTPSRVDIGLSATAHGDLA